jgi:cell division protein FtsB
MTKMVDKVVAFAEQKRSSIITRIENTSAAAILLKWVIANKVSTVLFFLFVFTYGYYYIQNSKLQEIALTAQIQALEKDQEEIEKQRKELVAKVKKYEEQLKDSIQVNQAAKEEVSKLKDVELKKRLEEVIKRLEGAR